MGRRRISARFQVAVRTPITPKSPRVRVSTTDPELRLFMRIPYDLD